MPSPLVIELGKMTVKYSNRIPEHRKKECTVIAHSFQPMYSLDLLSK